MIFGIKMKNLFSSNNAGKPVFGLYFFTVINNRFTRFFYKNVEKKLKCVKKTVSINFKCCLNLFVKMFLIFIFECIFLLPSNAQQSDYLFTSKYIGDKLSQSVVFRPLSSWAPNTIDVLTAAENLLEKRNKLYLLKPIVSERVLSKVSDVLQDTVDYLPLINGKNFVNQTARLAAQATALKKLGSNLGFVGDRIGNINDGLGVLNDLNNKDYPAVGWDVAAFAGTKVGGGSAAVSVIKSSWQAVGDVEKAIASGNRGELISALQSTDTAITLGAASVAGGLSGGGKGADAGNMAAATALGATQVVGNWIGEKTWQSPVMQYLAFSADERATTAANQAANDARDGALAAKRARDLQQIMANITATPVLVPVISLPATTPAPGSATSKPQFGTQNQQSRALIDLKTGTAMPSALPAPAGLARIGAGSSSGGGALSVTPVPPSGKMLFNSKAATTASNTAPGIKALPSVLNQASHPSGNIAAAVSGKTGQTGLQPKLPPPTGKVPVAAGSAVIAQKPLAPMPAPLPSGGNRSTTNAAQQVATATPFVIRKPYTPNAVVATPMMLPTPIKPGGKSNAIAAPLPSPVGAYQVPGKPSLRVNAAVSPRSVPGSGGNGNLPVYRPAGQIKTAAPAYQPPRSFVARTQSQPFHPQPALAAPQIVRQITINPTRQAAPVQVLRQPAQVFVQPQFVQRAPPNLFQPNFFPSAQQRSVFCKLSHKC